MDALYDAVVIGSGFGGSVVSCRLSEAGLAVLLLERGREYPPGGFPRGIHSLRSAFWDPDDGLYGLYDYRSFREIDILTASGLGGGSLIYSSISIEKPEGTFAGWPLSRKDLEPYYRKAREVLRPSAYPFDRTPYRETPKTMAMKRAGGERWFLPDIAVTWGKGPGLEEENDYGVIQRGCTLCGECTAGCNYGAKNSLNLNYLALGRRKGLEIRTGHIAERIEPTGDGYRVHYRLIHGERGSVRGRVVILSAGSPGSVEILLRNRDLYRTLPGVSRRLGHGFSANGDFVTASFRGRDPVEPTRGPVITSAIGYEWGMVEDGGIPDFLAWYMEGLIPSPGSAEGVLKGLIRYIGRRLGLVRETRIGDDVASILEGENVVRKMLPFLCMGLDRGDGRIYLAGDGRLEVSWNFRGNRPIFKRMMEETGRLARALGGELKVNPLWFMKKIITVHPLGGCAMGGSPEEGVVDPEGEVFGYRGLYVVDGSIMPGPVGVNPSLTIAAVAERAAEGILSRPIRAREV